VALPPGPLPIERPGERALEATGGVLDGARQIGPRVGDAQVAREKRDLNLAAFERAFAWWTGGQTHDDLLDPITETAERERDPPLQVGPKLLVDHDTGIVNVEFQWTPVIKIRTPARADDAEVALERPRKTGR
jgi:hypothetical protein